MKTFYNKLMGSLN